MAQEIERKFLVQGDFCPFVTSAMRIVQGYLSSVPERTVRVRIKGDQGFLTIKGVSTAPGISRYEFEKEIALSEAEELLKLCEPGVIEKMRHLVPVGDYVYEVDIFHGENEGLVIAEIELPTEDTVFVKPAWLGVEVTGDSCYYNAALSKLPFTKWIN